MNDDSDLVRRCLGGDRAAWADLLGRYGDLVYGLLWKAGLKDAAGADAFQEVSILLWKGLPRLKKAGSLLPWIATTTRRVAWRTTRRARAQASREKAVARKEAVPAEGPENLARLEEEQAVRRGLLALGERCRRLLALLYFETPEGGYDEVARRLDMPRGSIGPTRARCLEGLRRELAALGIGEPVSGERPAASIPRAPPKNQAGGPS